MFESSPQNANTWSDLCTTDAAGDCTSAVLSPGTYDVREKSAPTGWSTISELVFGGSSSGAGNQTHPYVGTATVSATGSANVSVQRTNSTGVQDPNHRFINVRDNHALPAAQCGITIALVLDRSGSILPNRQAFINAVNGVPGDPAQLGLLGALGGTPTTIKIYSFAATASGPSADFNLETTQGLTDARAAVTAIYNNLGGGTNWDAGLSLAAGSGAPVTIFLTDGNPTVWDGAPNGGGTVITLNDLTAGIASANTVKGTSTIFAVGAGSGITGSNLQLVSGPGQFFVSDIDDLERALQALANQFCGSRIHVRKLVGGQQQADWSFTAAGGGAGVTFTPTPVVTGGVNVDGVIAVNGIPASGTAIGTPVTVTESLTEHAGFSLTAASCALNSYPPADTGSPTNPQIAQIQRNQDWFCTFNNVFTPNSPSIATLLVPVGPVAIGAPVFDTAVLTGATATAGGTVTYTVYTNNTCTTGAIPAGVVTVTNGVVPNSNPVTFPTAGTFFWQAVYSGDPNNLGATSVCTCEALVVSPNAPSIATLLVPVGPVAIGAPVFDTAVLTGATATAGGTVTYTAYTNNTCTTGAIPAGTVTVTNGVVPNSIRHVPHRGDVLLAGGVLGATPTTSVRRACARPRPWCEPECAVDRDALVPLGPVAIGAPVFDTAVLTGATATAGGTVTYTAYTNNTCTTGAIPAGIVTVTNGVVPNSNPITFNTAGTFFWQAVYSGDPNNLGATSVCTSEALVVNPNAPSIATLLVPLGPVAIGAPVFDTAVLTGATATAGGTVTYTVYTNNTCTTGGSRRGP